jgi:hypothetical protein
MKLIWRYSKKDVRQAKKYFWENIVGVFCIGKNRVVKITYSSFEVVLQSTKHTMIYLSSGSSL